MPTLPAPRLLACGDGAISVEFGETIDPAINARVLALDAALAAAMPAGVIETVPTYRSLMIYVDPPRVDFAALRRTILLLAADPPIVRAPARRWRVPVVYGGAFGVDLDDVAACHAMRAEEIIARHCAAAYVVAMIGFMPGFAYLAGLDPALATPRRPEPRPRTPAQSVSIGGAQAAIASVEAPSGWSLIGRTPARGFMAGRDPVFLYVPGDEIHFERIDASEWAALDAAAESGAPVARCEAA